MKNIKLSDDFFAGTEDGESRLGAATVQSENRKALGVILGKNLEPAIPASAGEQPTQKSPASTRRSGTAERPRPQQVASRTPVPSTPWATAIILPFVLAQHLMVVTARILSILVPASSPNNSTRSEKAR